MANQQIENIEEINEAINPITPPINETEGLEILGHNRNQSVNLLRFSRSFFKVFLHLITLYSSIKTLTNGKENKIDKKSGFNLEKTDLTENDSNKLFSAKGALNLFNNLTTNFTDNINSAKEALRIDIARKEDKFVKNGAFNKDFGVAQNEVLEGSKLAEILGIEYDGVLNNTNVKVVGKGYYDTANKKIYKCTANTSINYADAGYFIEVSNNDLLGKLQNLIAISSYYKENVDVVSGVMSARFAVNAKKRGNVVTLTLTVIPLDVSTGPTSNKNINIILPEDFKPLMPVYGLVRTDQRKYQAAFNLTQDGISYEFSNQAEVGAGMGGTVTYTT